MPLPPLDRAKDFLLGADPELGFTDPENPGQLIDASGMVTDNRLRARFGLDGCGRVAELRPRPASEPMDLVQNIRRAMLSQRRNLADVEWRAGSTVGVQDPIGGHIHFGTARFHAGRDGATRTPIETCVRALDTYLMPALVLIEDPAQARVRRTRYGNLGDFRDNSHGFEYRAPASWLTSPYIALAVLSLAKTILWDVLHHGLRGRGHVAGSPSDRNVRLVRTARLRAAVKERWDRVRQCELYPRYQDEIGLIERLVRSGRTWFPDQPLKEAWGLAAPTDAPAASREPLPTQTLEDIWHGLPYTRSIASTLQPVHDTYIVNGYDCPRLRPIPDGHVARISHMIRDYPPRAAEMPAPPAGEHPNDRRIPQPVPVVTRPSHATPGHVVTFTERDLVSPPEQPWTTPVTITTAPVAAQPVTVTPPATTGRVARGISPVFSEALENLRASIRANRSAANATPATPTPRRRRRTSR